MPKLKSHRGAAKRFSRNANGRIKSRRANRSHILTKRCSKVKRQARTGTMINPVDVPAIVRMLTGC